MNLIKKASVSLWTDLKLFNKLEALWVIISLSAILIISLATANFDAPIWINVLSIMASTTGVLGTLMATKKSSWNYLWGLTNVIMYGFISLQSELYGEVMLNFAFYIPTNIVGWYLWYKNRGEDGVTVPKKLDIKTWIGVILFVGGATAGYGYGLKAMGGNTPFIDASSTVISVVGMILMMTRYREQWIMWFAVNVISVVMWSFRFVENDPAAIPMLVMWIIYVINSIIGYMKWRKIKED